jgi:hypothetical protein
VVVGGEEDLLSLRRPGDLAHGVVGEDGELLRVAAGARKMNGTTFRC